MTVGVVLAALLAGLALAGASPAHAQQAVSLASLEIGLWPEFDKPAVLVILNGQVAAGVALPARVTVHIPAAAGAPNAVAVVGAGGGLFQTPYNTSPAGGDIIVSFTASSAGFRVEYYDPSLAIHGDARSFGLRWKSDLAIQAVTVRVQQPYGASSPTGRPALVSAGTGQYGLNEYIAALGPLAAGDTASFDLGYTKTGSSLSATAVANQQKGTSAQPATGSLVWLIVALADLGLAGAGVVWYVRVSPPARRQPERRATTGAARRGSRPPTGAAPSARPAAMDRARARAPGRAEVATDVPAAGAGQAAKGSADAAPAAFCPQCGRRYQTGDRFCRQCGAPVRA